jgi:hypothetical protein
VWPDLESALGSGVTKIEDMPMQQIGESTFYFRNMIFYKHVNNLEETRGRSDISI